MIKTHSSFFLGRPLTCDSPNPCQFKAELQTSYEHVFVHQSKVCSSTFGAFAVESSLFSMLNLNSGLTITKMAKVRVMILLKSDLRFLSGQWGCCHTCWRSRLPGVCLAVCAAVSQADGVTATSCHVALTEPVGRLGGVRWELETEVGL